MSITIQEMQKQVFNLAKEKGWWPLGKPTAYNMEKEDEIQLNQVNIPEKLMLIVSELSEALEEHRTRDINDIYWVDERGLKHLYSSFEEALTGAIAGQKPEGFWVENADAVIRILDLFGAYQQDCEWFIKLKHTYNKTRPYRHGGKKC